VETGKVDADGRPKKRISLVEKRTLPRELFERAEEKLNPYIGHAFRAR
jgi:hypothetical protein